MEIKDVILVTENWKGTEINFLMSFEDYRKSVLPAFENTSSVAIESVMDLCESWRNQEHWAEIYYSANKSVTARYCAGEEQLRKFLNGYFNSSNQEWRFDTDRCSADCLNVYKDMILEQMELQAVLSTSMKKQVLPLDREICFIISMELISGCWKSCLKEIFFY